MTSGPARILAAGLGAFPEFAEDQRAQLRFTGAWRYRLGSPNDEGWYRGQCRFSASPPRGASYMK
jgi:hypothetical protein